MDSQMRVRPLPSPVLSKESEEETMNTYVELLCKAKGIPLRDYFRTAYIWRFNRDATLTAFQEDVDYYKEVDKLPEYVREYAKEHGYH